MKIRFTLMLFISLMLLNVCVSVESFGQTNENIFVYGDALPDAPELTARGDYQVGVQTLEFVNKGQIDILNSKGGSDPLYDRPLTVEVWYPTIKKDEEGELITYNEVMGTSGDPKRPVIPFTFYGRATRDAKPIITDGAFPLVVVSHGYVGSRYLMTYLTENIASKGYIVVAIDHTESTFRDAAGFKALCSIDPKIFYL